MIDEDGLSELEKRRRKRLAKAAQREAPSTSEADCSPDWKRLERGGRDACEAMDGMNAPPQGVMMEMGEEAERLKVSP